MLPPLVASSYKNSLSHPISASMNIALTGPKIPFLSMLIVRSSQRLSRLFLATQEVSSSRIGATEMMCGAAGLQLETRSRQFLISKHISTLRIRRCTMLSQADVRTREMPTLFARLISPQYCDSPL